MRINTIKKQSENLTEEKARIIAHLKADGCIFRGINKKTDYHFYLELNDINELKRSERDVISTYGLKSRWVQNRSGKKPSKKNWRVYFRSKLAYYDLQKYGRYYSQNWNIPASIIKSSKNVKKEFIRTFFDDEGSVILGQRELMLYSINLIGLQQIHELLEEFSIRGKIKSGYGFKRNVYALIIRGQYLINFAIEIGFSCVRKNEKLSEVLKELNPGSGTRTHDLMVSVNHRVAPQQTIRMATASHKHRACHAL